MKTETKKEILTYVIIITIIAVLYVLIHGTKFENVLINFFGI